MLDRLPVDAMSRDEAIALYWLLMSLLEPPVAQEWKGTVIYDVRHDGQEYTAGHPRGADAGRARDAHRQQHGRGAAELREPLLPAPRPIRRA